MNASRRLASSLTAVLTAGGNSVIPAYTKGKGKCEMSEIVEVEFELTAGASSQDGLRITNRKVICQTATEWIPGYSCRDKAIWVLTKIGWNCTHIAFALKTTPARIVRTQERIFTTTSSNPQAIVSIQEGV